MYEYILEKNDVRKLLKYICSLEGLNLMTMNEKYNEKNEQNRTINSLYSKFDKKTLRITELCDICDILGYDVVLKKRNRP